MAVSNRRSQECNGHTDKAYPDPPSLYISQHTHTHSRRGESSDKAEEATSRRFWHVVRNSPVVQWTDRYTDPTLSLSVTGCDDTSNAGCQNLKWVASESEPTKALLDLFRSCCEGSNWSDICLLTSRLSSKLSGMSTMTFITARPSYWKEWWHLSCVLSFFVVHGPAFPFLPPWNVSDWQQTFYWTEVIFPSHLMVIH